MALLRPIVPPTPGDRFDRTNESAFRRMTEAAVREAVADVQRVDQELGFIEPDTFNVKAFGAVGDGVADDTVAIQTTINEVESRGGGTVYLPVGTYRITSSLTISEGNVHLRGLLPGSIIVAGVAMANMVVVSGAPLKRHGSIESLRFDGAGLADWIISMDGWRNFNIRHNQVGDALIGFIHTEFSGVTDWAESIVEYNTASVSGAVIPPGEGMSYFLLAERANGNEIDFVTLRSNRHTRFGFDGVNSTEAWSIVLDTCNRCRIYDHFAQPFETGQFTGIVKISNTTATGGNTSGGHSITDLLAEWGAQTQPCVLIDGTYSGGGATAHIERNRIYNPRCQPNNPVVRLNASGTNAAVSGTVVQYPGNRMVPSDTIEVLSLSVVKTFIWTFTDSGSSLPTQILNPVGSNSVYINGVATQALGGTVPTTATMDVGYLVYDSDTGQWWGMGHDGNVAPVSFQGVVAANVQNVNYTLQASDAGKRVSGPNHAGVTYTVPDPHPFLIDTVVEISNGDSAQDVDVASTAAFTTFRIYTGAGTVDTTVVTVAPGGWGRFYFRGAAFVEVWGLGLSDGD